MLKMSKFDIILNNFTDRVRYLLRLYAHCDDPNEIMAAILRMEGSKSTQMRL